MGTPNPMEEALWEFELVGDVKNLLPNLKDRLPISCNIYNMAVKQNVFSSEMKFYTLGKAIHNGTWILATYWREDYGLDINISCPTSKENMTEMKEALLVTRIIPWDKPHIFSVTDQEMTPIISNICENIKGNTVRKNHCMMYYLNPEECLKAEKMTSDNTDLEVKALEKESGTRFLLSTWKFGKNGSELYLNKLLERNNSTGVFVKGILVSGIAMSGNGLMCMLYTNEEYRNKGYGKLCMLQQMRSMSQNGLIPCCAVECNNDVSIAFQKSIGLQFSHYIDYISFNGNPISSGEL